MHHKQPAEPHWQPGHASSELSTASELEVTQLNPSLTPSESESEHVKLSAAASAAGQSLLRVPRFIRIIRRPVTVTVMTLRFKLVSVPVPIGRLLTQVNLILPWPRPLTDSEVTASDIYYRDRVGT